jgi:hypothetical protein
MSMLRGQMQRRNAANVVFAQLRQSITHSCERGNVAMLGGSKR